MNVDTVAEQLLFTTIRIEAERAPGSVGIGTGFFFNLTRDGAVYPFLVTNKHVVAGAKTGAITFHTGVGGKLQLGKPHRVQIGDFDKLWFPHPDPNVDVTVAPLAGVLRFLEASGVTVFNRVVGPELLPSAEDLANFDALEEVVFIGFPSPIWDTVNFLPVIRKGITATPIAVDYQGQKQFLVDASVFPGSSGSPVFLFNNGIYANRGGGTVIGSRLKLLGVISGVHVQQELNRIVQVPAPTSDSAAALANRMINLGIVFKHTTIVETIDAFIGAHVERDANAPAVPPQK